jgi:hypothetical protein
MCTGACVLYKVKRVVVGENVTFMGAEEYLKNRGIEVIVLDNEECKQMMGDFVKEQPELWYVVCLLSGGCANPICSYFSLPSVNAFGIPFYGC